MFPHGENPPLPSWLLPLTYPSLLTLLNLKTISLSLNFPNYLQTILTLSKLIYKLSKVYPKPELTATLHQKPTF